MTWVPHPNLALGSTGSVDLLASPEGASASAGVSILSGTQAMTGSQASTLGEDDGRKLSHDELRVLRGYRPRPWRWLKWMLFVLAAAIGFTLGALILVHSLPGG